MKSQFELKKYLYKDMEKRYGKEINDLSYVRF